MQPTLVAQPFHHKGWVYEEKVDGYRMVAYKDDDAVTIMSRRARITPPGFSISRKHWPRSQPVHSFSTAR